LTDRLERNRFPPDRLKRTLSHWKTDPDLASVSAEVSIAKLPENEQESWRALWRRVDTLLDDLR
jgi:hypothetical protein